MHPPASVTVEVGRPRWLAVWMLACWSAGALLCALWWLADGGKAGGWRVVLPAFSIAAAAGLLIWQWRRLRPCRLRWDGEDWIWQPIQRSGAIERRGVAKVYLDLQAIMLLRFMPDDGPAEWLWIDRAMSGPHWAALRRAAFGYRSRGAAPIGASAP